MKGIFVAMMFMNCTFASSGKPAMKTTARATWSASIVGSTRIVPSGCGVPCFILAVIHGLLLKNTHAQVNLSFLTINPDHLRLISLAIDRDADHVPVFDLVFNHDEMDAHR